MGRVGLEKSISHPTRRVECLVDDGGIPCHGQAFYFEKDHDLIEVVCSVCDERFSLKEVVDSMVKRGQYNHVVEAAEGKKVINDV